MPRYFFHARNGSHLLLDAEGNEMSDLSQVRAFLREAVSIYPIPLDPAWTFEIANDEGEIVLIVALPELSRQLQ